MNHSPDKKVIHLDRYRKEKTQDTPSDPDVFDETEYIAYLIRKLDDELLE